MDIPAVCADKVMKAALKHIEHVAKAHAKGTCVYIQKWIQENVLNLLLCPVITISLGHVTPYVTSADV